MGSSATVTIERRGGLAGVGLATSRIRSRGVVDLGTLSSGERDAVERLFAQHSSAAAPRPPAHADAFEYSLTRSTAEGERTIVVPENEVPTVLQNAVKDELL